MARDFDSGPTRIVKQEKYVNERIDKKWLSKGKMVSDRLRGQPCLLEELKGIREEREYEQSEFSFHASSNPFPHLYTIDEHN